MTPFPRSPRSVAILAGCAVAMTACQEYDFGEQARRFVDNEAYAYSARLVERDLELRWPGILEGAMVQIAVDLAEVAARQPDFTAPINVAETRSPEEAAV